MTKLKIKLDYSTIASEEKKLKVFWTDIDIQRENEGEENIVTKLKKQEILFKTNCF